MKRGGLTAGLIIAICCTAITTQTQARPRQRRAAVPPLRPVVSVGNPVELLPRGRPGRLVWGVMGSAVPEKLIPQQQVKQLVRLGQGIARIGHVTLTGGCPGAPHIVARAAHEAGGCTAGVSPAHNLAEHAGLFKSPTDSLDVIQMTGTGGGMGFIAREKQNIRHSDILAFTAGRSGTLGELMFALQEPKVIALHEGSGGVSGNARKHILPYVGRGKGIVVSDSDPDRLISKALAAKRELDHRPAKRAIDRTPAKLDPKSLPKMTKRRQLTKEVALHNNVFAFLGTSLNTTAADRRKVDTLARLVGDRRDQPGGRAPVVVVPARKGLAGRFARKAQAAGARTLGISYANSVRQHLASGQAIRGLDTVLLTGEGKGVGELSDYDRAVEHSNVVFIAGGDHRTLGGMVFAMYHPTVIAVLETNGLSGKLRKEVLATFDKPAQAVMVFDKDPTRLYRRAVAEAEKLRAGPAKAKYIAPE